MSGKLKEQKKQHQIFVEKKDLTTKSLSPTSEELFDLMHLTSCEHAVKRWKPEWILCPVCSQPYELCIDMHDGVIGLQLHKTRKDLLA